MMHKRKLISTLFGIVFAGGAALYLLFSGFDDTVIYYKTVDELLTTPERFETRPVRINGRLVPNSVNVKPNTNEYRFKLVKRTKELTVAYSGILPDTMQEGQDLVVQGIYDRKTGLFLASEVLTKCPSKYDAEAASID
jgi:cytochrome c-type biogenesis protein CcmE